MRRLWRWLRHWWHPVQDAALCAPWEGPYIIGEHGPELLPDFTDYRIWARPPGPTTNGCTHPIEAVKSMPGQMGSHGAPWWHCWACGQEVTKDRAFIWLAPGTSIRKRGDTHSIVDATGFVLREWTDPDEIHWRAAA